MYPPGAKDAHSLRWCTIFAHETETSQTQLLHRAAPRDLHGNVTAAAHFGQRGAAATSVTAPAQRGRVGVENQCPSDDAATAGIAQHQPVTEHQGQRSVQHEAGVIVVEGSQSGGHCGGADVGDELRRHLGQRIPGGAANVDRAGAEPGVRGQQRIAAVHVLVRDGTQIECDAGDRAKARSGFAVTLQPADRDGAHAIDAPQLQDVPAGNRSGRKGSGDDGARPADGERAVDPESQSSVRRGRRNAGQDVVENGAQFGEAVAGVRRHDDRRRVAKTGVGELLARSSDHRVDPVRKRDRTW